MDAAYFNKEFSCQPIFNFAYFKSLSYTKKEMDFRLSPLKIVIGRVEMDMKIWFAHDTAHEAWDTSGVLKSRI